MVKLSTDFQIRNLDEDEKFASAEEAYTSHLKKIKDGCDANLMSYFGSDFFHDGVISSAQFSSDFQNFILNIECPNIQKKLNGNAYYIAPIRFKCIFRKVAALGFAARVLDEYNDPFEFENIPTKFLYSEINSLSEVDYFKNTNNNNYNSIVIKTLPSYRNISIIFEDLFVQPEEPLAFDLVRDHVDYLVPLLKLK